MTPLAPRIAPRPRPWPAELEAHLLRITPPDAPDVLALFQVLAVHPVMLERMRSFGGFLLGRHASLPLRAREIAIQRVTYLSGAEYEWGVHVHAFAAAAGLGDAEVRALAGAAPLSVLDEAALCLVELIDALHATRAVDDGLWQRLCAHFTEVQILEILMLYGWYRGIAAVCTVARVPLEAWQTRFAALPDGPGGSVGAAA